MPERLGAGLTLRPARPADLPAMAALLEAVIAEGDKTAFEGPMTAERIDALFLSGATCCGCMVALDGEKLLGFQGLDAQYLQGTGWADVSSFAAAAARGRGVGAALWLATRQAAESRGLRGLRAVIRAVNTGAQGYYRRCGFGAVTGTLPEGVVPDLPGRIVLVHPLHTGPENTHLSAPQAHKPVA